MISRRCCECSSRTTSQRCDDSCPISIRNKIWYSNGPEYPYYCHHNHQLDKGKPCLMIYIVIRLSKHTFLIHMGRADFFEVLETEILAEATVSHCYLCYVHEFASQDEG